MKADTDAGRIPAIRSMARIHDDASGRDKSLPRLDHQRLSNAEQGMRKNQEGSRLELIVAIEQWICLVLGIVCIAAGIWGIFLNISQSALPACLTWLGLAYAPTLRGTAVGCLVMGLVLVRRGVTTQS